MRAQEIGNDAPFQSVFLWGFKREFVDFDSEVFDAQVDQLEGTEQRDYSDNDGVA